MTRKKEEEVQKALAEVEGLKEYMEDMEKAHAKLLMEKEHKWADEITELDERARNLVKRRDKEIQ